MSEYTNHPAAELFPMMDSDELEKLANDVRENGLLEPVVLYHGQILDGRNRLAACELAGVRPRFTEVDGDVPSPTLFVVSKNLHRRHLTASQRGAIGAEVVELLKDEAVKRGHSNLIHQPHTSATPIGVAERAGTVAAVARQVQAGEGTIQRALEVKRADPAMFEKIKSGELTAWAAREKLPPKTEPRRGIRKNKTAPYEAQTDGQRRLAEAQKQKMVTGMSTMRGSARGLAELDVPMILSVCSNQDIKTWGDIAREVTHNIRVFTNRFEKGTK
jgi:hypothetical protein